MLTPYWSQHGDLSEGRGWLERALAATRDPSPHRAKALTGAAELARFQGDLDRAEALADEGRSVARACGERTEEANAITVLGSVAGGRGDHATAVAYLEDALARFRALGKRWETAIVLGGLGGYLVSRDPVRADGLLREALALYHASGDTKGSAYARMGLAEIAFRRDASVEAAALMEEAVASARAEGSSAALVGPLVVLGCMRLGRSDHDGAEDAFTEALGACRANGRDSLLAPIFIYLGVVALRRTNVTGGAAWLAKGLRRIRDAGLSQFDGEEEVVVALTDLADALTDLGRPEAAARLLGAIDALPLAGCADWPPEHAHRADVTDRARTGLGAPAFAEHRSRGRAWTPEEASPRRWRRQRRSRQPRDSRVRAVVPLGDSSATQSLARPTCRAPISAPADRF